MGKTFLLFQPHQVNDDDTLETLVDFMLAFANNMRNLARKSGVTVPLPIDKGYENIKKIADSLSVNPADIPDSNEALQQLLCNWVKSGGLEHNLVLAKQIHHVTKDDETTEALNTVTAAYHELEDAYRAISSQNTHSN